MLGKLVQCSPWLTEGVFLSMEISRLAEELCSGIVLDCGDRITLRQPRATLDKLPNIDILKKD